MPHPAPEIPDLARIVLDIGSGAGTGAFVPRPGRMDIAVDIERDLLRSASKRYAAVAAASGEALPFESESIDFIVSSVALPYMDIRKALAEIHRILAPGGSVWLLLHGWGMIRRRTKNAVRDRNLRDLCYCLYLAANSASLHLGLPQFRFPLGKRRMESFQTLAGIRRELARHGFSEIQVSYNKYFLATAVKPGAQLAGRSQLRPGASDQFEEAVLVNVASA